MKLSVPADRIRCLAFQKRGEAMKRTLMAIAAATTLALSTLAPAPAHAQRGVAAGVAAGRGCYWQRQRFWDGYGWRVRRVQVCD
jgi:hypothetical protein